MVAKSASLKGLERSTPRTVAPRICPVGSTAVMTPPRCWSGLYCAGLARDVCAAGRRGAGAPPAEARPWLRSLYQEDCMEIKAAVFRKVHEALTIEPVEIDKPWGREVLVRT